MAPKVPVEASPTGGVQAFSIQGRLFRERERLFCMTDEEREWRRKWIKDQHLAHDEPRYVPMIYKELYNPIRRCYRYPLDALFQAIEPILGKKLAIATRAVTGKLLIGFAAVYAATYYFKYNTNNWTRKGGFRVITSRRSWVPGDPGYPVQPDRHVGADYASRGFKNSPI